MKRKKFQKGQKVVVRGYRVRRIIDFIAKDDSGMVRLTKHVRGFNWWNAEDLRPLTKRERGRK